MTNVTINDKTKKGSYSLDEEMWATIPEKPIGVPYQIFIKINSSEPFDICFNMGGSSPIVEFTAEFIDTNIWKLSNFTGDTLSATLR